MPKIINTKLDQREDRLTQTLVFPKFSYIYRYTWCLNLLRNIMIESAVTAHAKAKAITQIRPDYQNKGERKAQSQRQ